MERTLSKNNMRGTELKVLIIRGKINEKYMNSNIEEILKEFDISYDIIFEIAEISNKINNSYYDIIFIEDEFMRDNSEKKDLLELIKIIKENNYDKEMLIVGLLNNENNVYRKILNDNDIELILFKPVKKGQIVVILRNDFKWEVFR